MSRAGEAFREVYGQAPEGVWRAPGRVNLIGEHTDYNDGYVMPFAVPWGVTAAVSRREDGRVALASLQAPGREVTLDELVPGRVEGWAAYPAGVVWALRERGLPVGGANILVDGDVPAGAGLSSSAALEVSVALALNDLYGLGLPRTEIALLAQRAENDFVGMPCGVMDQMASALGREGHALFIDCRTLKAHPVPLDTGDMTILIIDTRVHHELADGQYAVRREQCEQAAKTLGVVSLRDVEDLAGALSRLSGAPRRRTEHVVCENHRVQAVVGLLRAGAVPEIGPMLNASHISLRDLYEVSCEELDVAVESAVRGGARGARMTGGGFGGSAIALVANDRLEDVKSAVRAAYADRGWQEPRFHPATPAQGAHRLA
ncbi:galactokinase [Bailinhaonella thermotolerans]|uniref:Galactokinase n=1 Tax=Bailinhaonella thermotolerans TaxID=1070861 RepID=A0A3A4AK84_9ACTN|nr:galactokinase [Bailinhaonella thermotolerans]RJL21426.1 galactokinase [Bailinhaonella thermotolerans]